MNWRPPLYRLLLLYLRLPKAWSSENREVAALLTLPFTRKPSDDCWLASSAGLGISTAFSPAAPGAAGFLTSAGALSAGSGAGGRFASFVIWSSGSSVSSHFAVAVFVETVISLWRVEKHCISTSICHTPSARSAKLYRPPWSVTVVSFFVPCVTVTVAPGTGKPPKVTWPWYAEAAARMGKVSAARAQTR